MDKVKKYLPHIIAGSVLAVALIVSLLVIGLGKLNNGGNHTNSGESSTETVSIFEGDFNSITLTEDYKLSDLDVKATGGTGKQVTVAKAVPFDLSNHSLDLNGYTLKIVSAEVGCNVKFSSGTITNGTLDISVPNGDITFDKVTLDASVNYGLEAASSTIRFSNSQCSGKGSVKSDSRVEVAYSKLEEILLEGNSKLEANTGATLGTVSVSKNATGASVNVSASAKVGGIEVSAKAQINIAGEVKNVTVNEGATSSEIEVTVSKSANVESVAINAPAKVDLGGDVANVSVGKNASTEDAKVQVNLSAQANVQQMSVDGSANIEVEGTVGNLVVNETATETSINVSGSKASVGTVVVNADNAKIEGESSAVSQVVVSEKVKDTVDIPEDVNKTVVTEDEIKDYTKAHKYVETDRKDATCTQKGSITYTCTDCSDSYTTVILARGHDFKSTITKLPTAAINGERLYTCDVCGYSYTEKIKATGIESDSVTALIAALVGDGTYSIKISDGAEFSAIEVEGGEEYVNGTVTFKVAEAVIDITDGYATGHIKFEASIPTYNPRTDKFDGKDVVFYVYLDDNVACFEVLGGGMEEAFVGSIGVETVLNALLNRFARIPVLGIYHVLDVETLYEMYEAYNEVSAILSTFKPAIDGAIQGVVGSTEGVDVIGYLIKQLYVGEVVNGNTVYTLSTESLVKLATYIQENSVADIIDDLMGENTVDSIYSLALALPNYTVEEIADTSILMAENYGINVETTFTAIENLVKEYADLKLT